VRRMSDPSAPLPGVADAAPGRPVVLPDGWTVTVTDKIVSTVDGVAAKTTKPVTLVARGLVYGLLLGTAGLIALVMLVAFVLRGLVVIADLIPGVNGRDGRPVWVVDLFLGSLLLVGSAWLMRKGRTPKHDDDAS
jgi:hypothetical protein